MAKLNVPNADVSMDNYIFAVVASKVMPEVTMAGATTDE